MITSAYRGPSGHVVVNFTTSDLRRMHVSMRYQDSTAEKIGAAIRATIDGLHRPTKPLSPDLKGL